jgi:hypothetical protein
LIALPALQTQLHLPAFLRELFKTIEHPDSGQAKNEFFFWPLGGSEVQPHSEINLPGRMA